MAITVVTDRTLADVTNKTAKGKYSYLDLNRVGTAVNEIAELFNDNGYTNTVVGKVDWVATDTPNVTQMSAYLQNVTDLRAILGVKTSTPDTPTSMAFLNYIKANHVEQILLDIYTIVSGMIAEYKPLGMFNLGQNNGIV